MITREEIEAKVIADAINNEDKNIDWTRLTFDVSEAGEDYWKHKVLNAYIDGERITFSSLAWSQLLSRLKIPASFFNRLKHDTRCSILQEMNEARTRRKSNSYKFRIRKVPASSGIAEMKYVRATLTTAYGTSMDDRFSIPMILEQLKDYNPRYTHFNQDGEATELHVRFDNTKMVHDGTELQAGIVIVNSEVGLSKLWIEPAIYVTGGPMGMQYEVAIHSHESEENTLGFTHLYAWNRDEDIQRAVKRAIDLGQIGIIQYLENAN